MSPAGTPETVSTSLQSLMPHLTDRALHLLMSEIEILVETHAQNIVTEFGVYFFGSDRRKHLYDCVSGKCSCAFFLETGLPC